MVTRAPVSVVNIAGGYASIHRGGHVIGNEPIAMYFGSRERMSCSIFHGRVSSGVGAYNRNSSQLRLVSSPVCIVKGLNTICQSRVNNY